MSRPTIETEVLSNTEAPQVFGFDTALSIVDIGSGCQAYTQQGVLPGKERILILPPNREVPSVVSLQSQCLGTGWSDGRRVHTLVDIDSKQRIEKQRTGSMALIVQPPTLVNGLLRTSKPLPG